MQDFIPVAMVKELVQAVKGEKQELQFEATLRLEPALQALKDGFSLTSIMQRAAEQLECCLIAQILASTSGNKAETARILKVDYKTLYRKMYKYFGTFSDFVPAAELNGHTPLAAWSHSVPTDAMVDLNSSVS
jgi:DNA-binding NtrC family response regulator